MMTSQNEAPDVLRVQDESDLSSRLNKLLAALGEPSPSDEEPASLREPLREGRAQGRAHRIELERQIRELREAERALEASRDRYARLFELAPMAFVVLGRDGTVRDINLQALDLLGEDRDRLVGASLSDYLRPEDRGPFREALARASAPGAGRPRSLSLRLAGPQGRDTLRLTSLARLGEGGDECCCASIEADPAEAPAPLPTESEGLGQAVLDTLSSQVAVLDTRGRIVAVNRAWQHFADGNGGSQALALGVGLDYLAVCRSVEGDEAGYAHAVAEGLADVIEHRLPAFSSEYPCHGPGTRRWFALSATPLERDAGGAVVVHFDVTARKLAEIEARRARDAAAQTARVNAVGILAASLIHELTQPLSAAGFFSGAAVSMLAQERWDPQRLKQALAGTDSQLQRAGEIVERLRAFLRGREMRMQTVLLDSVVERALGLVEWFASDKRVRLRYPQQVPGVSVLADPLQIEQVLVNLICNSIQAIDEAGTALREISVEVDAGPRETEVRVRDTGPGLPPAIYERLFELFTSTGELGMGMGLAICRDIVEAHGGRLWTDPSGDGSGAVFHFSLPRQEA